MVAKHILLAASAAFCLTIPMAGHAAGTPGETAPVILKGSMEDTAPVAEDAQNAGTPVASPQADENTGGAATDSTAPHPTSAVASESGEAGIGEADTPTDGETVPSTTASAPASAEGHTATAVAEQHPLAKLKWSFDGIFGTYDRGALQRGFQVYKEVCAACHSMDRLSYRNLAELGYTEAEIKAIAAEATMTDGPDEEGEMYERPGRPSDRFKAPYPNIQAAKAVNNGAYPPDFSLLDKSRHGGADYIYAILTGYSDAPSGVELMPGQYWNKAMHGNVIAMPPPLSVDQVAYSEGTEQSVEQYAKDVAHFMTWASEPTMEIRKKTGVKAFLFLLIFSAVLYGVKRKIWSDLH